MTAANGKPVDLNTLVHDIKEAIEELEHEAGSGRHPDLMAAIDRLAGLCGQPDTDRLDWLGRAGYVSFGVVCDAPHDGEFHLTSDVTPVAYGKSLRDAIDAASAKKATK